MSNVDPTRRSVPDPVTSTQVSRCAICDQPISHVGLCSNHTLADELLYQHDLWLFGRWIGRRRSQQRNTVLTPLGRFTAFRQKYGVEP